MARTRGIQPGSGVVYAGEAELLDREGRPINPIAHHATADPAEITPAPEEPPEPSGPIRYYCDARTLNRNMDGYEAVMLVNALLDLLPMELAEEKWAAMPADVRQHFRRV